MSTEPSTPSERFRRVAAAFTERVEAVPPGAWERPAPCAGWVARDVVRHLVEWVPGVLRAGASVELPAGTDVASDPAGAWRGLATGLQAILDDADASARTFSHPLAGTYRLDDAIVTLVLGDVLVHTWDLARATGQDERLDEAEVAGMYAGLVPMDDALRASGHYGPRVEVADDADVQTRLLAFTGRDPG